MVGKTKEKWLTEACSEYLKRLKPYHRIEIIEVADCPLKNQGIDIVKAKEAESIRRLLNPDDYLILLDERGEQKRSLEFARFLHNLCFKKRIVIVVGGVYGTHDTLKAEAACLLGLSNLTFTHQMVRLILLEQLYRASMINANKPYHY